MTEMISTRFFCELLNAVFRFVLRCVGAETDRGGGGCSKSRAAESIGFSSESTRTPESVF